MNEYQNDDEYVQIKKQVHYHHNDTAWSGLKNNW